MNQLFGLQHRGDRHLGCAAGASPLDSGRAALPPRRPPARIAPTERAASTHERTTDSEKRTTCAVVSLA